MARTRNSLSATHSLSVNFCVSEFCGSSTSGASSVPETFVSSVLVGTTVDMMVMERKRGGAALAQSTPQAQLQRSHEFI